MKYSCDTNPFHIEKGKIMLIQPYEQCVLQSFRLPVSLKEKISKFAKKNKMNNSQYIRLIVDYWFKREERRIQKRKVS